MSRAKPHFVRVVDAPGQPARFYQEQSKTAALATGQRVFDSGWVGAVVTVVAGYVGENTPGEPVKVWS